MWVIKKPLSSLPKMHIGLGVHARCRVPALGQRIGERHREAPGIGGSDHLFRIGSLAVFEPAVE